MKYLLFAMLFMTLNVPSSFACSPSVRANFFMNTDAEIEWSSSLYPPKIKGINVKRGRSPCNFGTIKIEILMPKNSFYTISEVGFYFIHDTAEPLNSIYPNIPLTAKKNENGKLYLEFDWLDEYPNSKLKTSFYIVTVLKDSRMSSLSELIVVNE